MFEEPIVVMIIKIKHKNVITVGNFMNLFRKCLFKIQTGKNYKRYGKTSI